VGTGTSRRAPPRGAELVPGPVDQVMKLIESLERYSAVRRERPALKW